MLACTRIRAWPDFERSCHIMRVINLVPLLLAAARAAEDAHAGHDHSGTPYDWAGIFATPEATHTFRVQEVNGKVRRECRVSHPFVCPQAMPILHHIHELSFRSFLTLSPRIRAKRMPPSFTRTR